MLLIADKWKDYACLDAGNGEKLEEWNGVILRRPDPQAIWNVDTSQNYWKKIDAIYHRSKSGGGSWEYKHTLPEQWTIAYKDLTFKVSPTGFKHTGIFPEQAVNWDWMRDLIQTHVQEDLRILNLFAYTGGATMACAKAGAKEVVHVDASKGMVNWAKENRDLSHLEDKTIRFIVDDVIKVEHITGLSWILLPMVEVLMVKCGSLKKRLLLSSKNLSIFLMRMDCSSSSIPIQQVSLLLC